MNILSIFNSLKFVSSRFLITLLAVITILIVTPLKKSFGSPNDVWVIMVVLEIKDEHHVPGYYGGNFTSKKDCNEALSRMFKKMPFDKSLTDDLWTVYTKKSGYFSGSYVCMQLPPTLIELKINE